MASRVRQSLRKGHRALRARRFAEAFEAFRRAADAAPRDPRGSMQLALAYAAAGECEASGAAADALLERHGENAVALLAAGRCRLECDDPAGARPLLEAAVERRPDNVLVQQYLALCALMNGEVAGAAERVDRVGLAANARFLALFSYEVERRFQPASLDRAESGGEESESETQRPAPRFAARIARLERRATGKWPTSPFGRLARRRIARRLERIGERAYDRARFADALAAFEAAWRASEETDLALLGAGLSAMRMDRLDLALQWLARGHALRPHDGPLAATYGDCLFRLGRYADALAVYNGLQPAGPDDFHAHYGRGACLALLGRKRAALQQFHIAFEQYRLDTIDDCLVPSWKELRGRHTPGGSAKRD